MMCAMLFLLVVCVPLLLRVFCWWLCRRCPGLAVLISARTLLVCCFFWGGAAAPCLFGALPARPAVLCGVLLLLVACVPFVALRFVLVVLLQPQPTPPPPPPGRCLGGLWWFLSRPPRLFFVFIIFLFRFSRSCFLSPGPLASGLVRPPVYVVPWCAVLACPSVWFISPLRL